MLNPMVLIAGPCVIEDEGFVLEVAAECKKQLQGLNVDYYFKASFDKANRTAVEGFRGPGLQEGLRILERVKSQLGLKVFTDFHLPEQAERVASVVDFLQVPAFLCRQTDMIVAAAKAAEKFKRKLNLKKGQFIAPQDTQNMVKKVCESLHLSQVPEWLYLTERGTCFGYHNLIVDMSTFDIMKKTQAQVIFDATHSIQMPSSQGGQSGGKRQHLISLTRAAFAAGAQGLFLECHPDPRAAKSDGATSLPLVLLRPFVEQCLKIREMIHALPVLEHPDLCQ
jgi:2-dehydro-3-deoxyphosphooctonate aldolase (KDO 8-P synthase)